MEISNKINQINWYLSKNYYVKDNRFFTKHDHQHEWGFSIADSLPSIFSFDKQFCTEALTKWAYENNLNNESFEIAWGVRKLKTTWAPEMAQDLQVQYGINTAEEQLTNILAEELAREIDAQILRDLRSQFKQPNDLLGVVKCLGYEPSQTVYDPTDFTPRKHFVSTTYNEMVNERQNNPFWQDWIRTREQD
jgi:hypothetical protein